MHERNIKERKKAKEISGKSKERGGEGRKNNEGEKSKKKKKRKPEVLLFGKLASDGS